MSKTQKYIDAAREETSKLLDKIEQNWKSQKASITITHFIGGALVSVQFNIVVEQKRVVFTIYKDGVKTSNYLTLNHLKVITSMLREIEPLFPTDV